MSGFAWAKEPMVERLKDLEPDIPLTAIYGGDSWVSAISKEEFVTKGNRPDSSYTVVKVSTL